MTKKSFLITAIIGLLLVGGGGFGYYTWKMNQVGFRGIALPVKGVKDEVCKEWEAAFEKALAQDDLLKSIIEETNYAEKVSVPANEAVEHLKKSVRVRFKKRDESLEIGLVGKRKYDESITEIAPVLYRKAAEVVAAAEPSFKQYTELAQKAREKAPPSE